MIRKGQWYTYCCIEDLSQADEDFESDEELDAMVWNTLKEALEELDES